jgi:Uma2 family endonuclease
MAALPNTGMTPIWHMSVDQYHAMIDNGILGPEDPVELLEGILVQKMSKNPPRSFTTDGTVEALRRIAPAGWYVRAQDPITLSKSEPEPDVAFVRGDRRDYSARHPGPGDIAIVVEVAEATLDRDKILKKRIYAAAGIPIYWLINLVKLRIEVYSEPKSGDYQQYTVYGSDDSVPVTLDGGALSAIPVRSLLP